MNPLTGADIERLSRLLATAVSPPELAMIVYATTGDQLGVAYANPNQPLRMAIQELLVALERDGVTHLFLTGVYARKPGRADVRAAILQACPAAAAAAEAPDGTLSVQKAGVAQAGEPTAALAPGLQRNVRPNLAMVPIAVWIERMLRIERQVCRIERDAAALGTGFLVGPEAVLTNWHVVEAAHKAGKVASLGCRFDYHLLSDTSRQAGVVAPLHADGVVDLAPYAPAERTATPETPPPNADELDYALLRLAEPIGAEAPAGQGRGWITLPSAPVPASAGAPLLIVQHPDGGPMKLALDTQAVIGPRANGLRLRYHTNTDPGSSGSPCFSMDWDLVALHHYGDPSWQAPRFNQGVPAELIRASIQAHGRGALIP